MDLFFYSCRNNLFAIGNFLTLELFEGPEWYLKLINLLTVFSLQVVVKFIRKEKVLRDCWLEDNDMGRVPIEVSILSRLQHPHIVNVSDKSLVGL